MSKNYWDEEVNDAINEFISNKDLSERELAQLYTHEIHPAFETAAESLVYRDNLHTSSKLSGTELVNRGIAKAYEALRKSREGVDEDKYFDPEKGKSFSYFSVSIKWHLIQCINKANRNKNNFYSMDSSPSNVDSKDYWDSKIHQEAISQTKDEIEVTMFSDLLETFLSFVESNVNDLWIKPARRRTALAIVEFIREGNLGQFHLRKSLRKIRKKANIEVNNYAFTSVRKDMLKIYERIKKKWEKDGKVDEDTIIWMRQKDWPGSPSSEEREKIKEQYYELQKQRGNL